MSPGARILLMRERVVGDAERGQYLDTLRSTKRRCASQGVQFWAFVNGQDDHRYVEFAEAKQPELLTAAELDTGAPASVWRAIELD